MKRKAIILAAALFVVVGGVVTSQAQLLSVRYRAEIPFDFVAKGKQYAAGGYVVRLMEMRSTPGPLIIERRDGREGHIISNWQGGPITKTNKGKLTFMKIANSYTLIEVSTPGYGAKVKVRKAADARQLALAKVEFITIDLSGTSDS